MSAEPRVIAFASQKGGVGKTTSTINTAAGLAELGMKVLIIDLDPQGNASTGLGIPPTERRLTTYDLFLTNEAPSSILRETSIPGIWVSPADGDLASSDLALISNVRRMHLLKDALRQPRMAAFAFDFILIDCPPSLSLLTLNALTASDSVLIPLQAEFFALEGLTQLMLTVREVRQTTNAALRIEGVLLTMYDGRNRLAQQVERDARDALGDLVYKVVIPRSVRISEAPSFALPVLKYEPMSRGSDAYRHIARLILERADIRKNEYAG